MDLEAGDVADPFNNPSGEARRKKAKDFRKKQLEQYQAWSLATDGESVRSNGIHTRSTSGGNSMKGEVTFVAKDRLRDAVSRSDINEGESFCSLNLEMKS